MKSYLHQVVPKSLFGSLKVFSGNVSPQRLILSALTALLNTIRIFNRSQQKEKRSKTLSELCAFAVKLILLFGYLKIIDFSKQNIP